VSGGKSNFQLESEHEAQKKNSVLKRWKSGGCLHNLTHARSMHALIWSSVFELRLSLRLSSITSIFYREVFSLAVKIKCVCILIGCVRSKNINLHFYKYPLNYRRESPERLYIAFPCSFHIVIKTLKWVAKRVRMRVWMAMFSIIRME
jgi:hypothetical protein